MPAAVPNIATTASKRTKDRIGEGYAGPVAEGLDGVYKGHPKGGSDERYPLDVTWVTTPGHQIHNPRRCSQQLGPRSARAKFL
jgi:hypothetical protein